MPRSSHGHTRPWQNAAQRIICLRKRRKKEKKEEEKYERERPAHKRHNCESKTLELDQWINLKGVQSWCTSTRFFVGSFEFYDHCFNQENFRIFERQISAATSLLHPPRWVWIRPCQFIWQPNIRIWLWPNSGDRRNRVNALSPDSMQTS